MSTLSVGGAAHIGRRASAFFGRTSVFMSALSIGDAACIGRVSAFFGRTSFSMSALSISDAACFGRVSAFFGRASVFMSALSIGDAACFGRVSAFFGRAGVLPALGRAFVLGLCALPAFVGLAATEDLMHDAAQFGLRVSEFFTPALGRAFVLVLGARPVAFVGQRLVVVCEAVALLWLELVLPCGRVAVALLWLTVRLPCG